MIIELFFNKELLSISLKVFCNKSLLYGGSKKIISYFFVARLKTLMNRYNHF